MKLHTDNHGFEGCLPEKRIAMKIKSSAKMFEILSSGIYKDKILAVIREYVCNAFDAHVSVGKRDVPFTVRMPNRFDPTFAVEDYGTGVDPALIGEIFWTYGESSKTNSNDTIGALGLGSKSAFAYTKSSFIVKNRWHGKEYTYFCFINEDGEPEGSPVGEAETDAKDGITVEFAVRENDIAAFYARFQRLFKYWQNVRPNVINADREAFGKEPVKVLEGKAWYLETIESAGTDRNYALAIMGNVQYPIEAEAIPNLPVQLKMIASNPFVITFPMGSLEFASSRESLSYTEHTSKVIVDRLEEVRAEIAKSFHKKVFAASTSHLDFIANFSKTFNEFRKVFRAETGSHRHGVDEDTNSIYVDILVENRNKAKSLMFKGQEFKISDLINGNYHQEFNGYSSFGMYTVDHRGSRNVRLYVKNVTSLSFTAKADMTKDLLGYPIAAGTCVSNGIEWKSPYFSKRKLNGIDDDGESKLGTTDLLIVNREQFDVETTIKFRYTGRGVKLIINDVGSSGNDRFKLMTAVNHQLFFINFHPKLTTLDAVIADVKKFVDTRMSGAEIVMMSDLPDDRAPIAKVKTDSSTMKVRYKTINVMPTKKQVFDVGYGLIGSSVNYNVPGTVAMFKSTKMIDELVKIDDMKKGTNLYVVKRRSNNDFYIDVGSHHRCDYLDDSILMSIALQQGFIDEYIDTAVDGKMSFRIYILTEGQISALEKQGVKFKSLKTVIADKITAMKTTDDFVKKVERSKSVMKVQMLRQFIECLGQAGEKTTDLELSTFTDLIKEYLEIQSSQVFQDALALMYIYVQTVASANVRDSSSAINREIVQKYPLFEYMNFNQSFQPRSQNKAFVARIMHYVAQIEAEAAIVEVESVI